MWQYNYTYTAELYHHGILGQRWGIRRFQNPDGSLTKAGQMRYNKDGGRKSAGSASPKAAHNGLALTDKQKRAVAIGATAAVGALAVYGAYKTGYLKSEPLMGEVINAGKARAQEQLGEVVRESGGAIRKLAKPETLEESLKNANPLRGTEKGINNCTYCGITGFLRQHGYDVVARSTGGNTQNQNGVVEFCFKNVKVFDGSAIKFGKSPKDAAEMLVRRFGNNAEGVCGVQWVNGLSHTFNWKIENGNALFIDFQQGKIGEQINDYWKMIDPNGYLQLARLDNAEIDWAEVQKIVEPR